MFYRQKSHSFFSYLTLPSGLPVRRSLLYCRMFEGANKVNTIHQTMSNKLGQFSDMCADLRPKQQSSVSHYSTQRVEHARPEKRQKRRSRKSQAMNRREGRGYVDAQCQNGTNMEAGQEDEVNNYRGCWRPFQDRWKPVPTEGSQRHLSQNHESEGAASHRYSTGDGHPQKRPDIAMNASDQTLDSNSPGYPPFSEASRPVLGQQSHSQYMEVSESSSGGVHQNVTFRDVNTSLDHSHWSSLSNQFHAPSPCVPPFEQQLQSQQQHQLPSAPYGLGYNLFGMPPLGNITTGFDPLALASAAAFVDVFGQQNKMNSQGLEVLPSQAYSPAVAPISADAGQSSNARNSTRGTTPQLSKGPQPVVAPMPTKEYMQQAAKPPKRLAFPQPLLIILDLNGTLIHRSHRRLPPSFARRPGLDAFLTSIFAKHKVMIWSSSQPITVRAVCEKLFPGWMRAALVAEWGRDKFGLTHSQYKEKIQVYKILDKVWGDKSIQAKYPKNVTVVRKGHNNNPDVPVQKSRWDQSNTVLIDDSKLKALAQPYNILEIPEFTNDPKVDETHTFDVVLKKLEILANHEDVSQMFRHWETRRKQKEAENPKTGNDPIGEEPSETQGIEDNVSELSDGPDPDAAIAVSDGASIPEDGAPMTRNQRRKARKEDRKAATAARKKEKKAAAKAAKRAAKREAKNQPGRDGDSSVQPESTKNPNKIPIPAVDTVSDDAASPAPSRSSENFLLDKLEESLSVSPGKAADSLK